MKGPCKSQHKTYKCNESADSGCPKFWPVADEEAQQRNHTWLAQHPNPSLVPVFHTLSKSHTALGKGSISNQFPQEIPCLKGPTQKIEKKISMTGEHFKKDKRDRLGATKRKMKEDKHYICIGPHSFKPEGSLEMIPTSHSGAPLGQLYHFRTNTTHSYR